MLINHDFLKDISCRIYKPSYFAKETSDEYNYYWINLEPGIPVEYNQDEDCWSEVVILEISQDGIGDGNFEGNWNVSLLWPFEGDYVPVPRPFRTIEELNQFITLSAYNAC